MPDSPPDSASEPPYSPPETNRSCSSIGGSPRKPLRNTTICLIHNNYLDLAGRENMTKEMIQRWWSDRGTTTRVQIFSFFPYYSQLVLLL